ncbi:DUF3540 domain-containing protein [Yersinia pekkanenii]|uniref:Protein of uncharacterized function (DUF3540) n=1 Tax=Yersinia pekkanenii TaxID=1288385 RepID=A0A0T9QQW6_9GAMM|nr:DUF3540 domain-containing protein [Yersinia pekkanenii]CNI23940.1 Protein of uncharacterised function (DUF3540) [Yersinia pekkanenii]CRY67331.1 Protein of uncharacterised function (DUF3540) [Yersinia pekkanenii]
MSKLATLLKFQRYLPDYQVHSSKKTLSVGSRQPQIMTAKVSSIDNGSVLLHGYETLPVTNAASCLFLPEIGDQVSAVIDQQKIYITAILYRATPDSPLVMNSGDIPLHLVTTALEIHSPERIEIHTGHFSLMARTSLWVATTMHQVADSLFVRAKQASREVENTDEIHARHINQQADQSLIINSRIGSLNATSVLKIDGGQVHMG